MCTPRIRPRVRIDGARRPRAELCGGRGTEYVVDIGRPIDFKETRAAGVWSFQQTSVEQKTRFGKLLRRVFPKVFNHSR